MKKLRGAVIGVGYLGRFHAQKYKALMAELPIELVGVFDTNKDQSKQVANELGVLSFETTQEMIGQVDLVTIATATSFHYEVAKFFLNQGIHCLVEKPMTVTVSEAQDLVRIASDRSLVLSVGHSERFNPAFVKAKELVRNPHMIELTRHAPYKSRGADVSVVHDLMVHDLDLLRALVPGEIRMIEAKGGKLISPTYDWAQASFSFGGGRAAMISVSRVAPLMTRILRLVGTEESVVADLQNGVVELARMKGPDQIEIERIEVGKGDNLLAETRAFIQAVLGQDSMTVGGAHGMAAMEWIHRLMDRIGAPA